MAKNAKSPELARMLYYQILSGVIAHGEKLPTVEELMRRYETTKATITRAFDLMEEKSLLMRKAGKGVFAKCPAKRHFGIVYNKESLNSPLTFHSAFQRCFAERCQAMGYEFHQFDSVENEADAEAFMKRLSASPVDTLLVSSRFLAENRVKYLDDLLVFPIGLHSYRNLPTTVSCTTENIAFDGAMALFQEGIEQVFLFRNPFTFEWRKNPDDTMLFSFKEALRNHGILFDPIYYRRVQMTEEAAYQEVMALGGELRKRKSGIVSSDSIFTAGILRALKELRIPAKVVTHANSEADFGSRDKNLISFVAPLNQMIDRIFSLSHMRIFNTGSVVTNESFPLVRGK